MKDIYLHKSDLRFHFTGQQETEKSVLVEDTAASDGALVSSIVDGNVGEEHPGQAGEIDGAGTVRVSCLC